MTAHRPFFLSELSSRWRARAVFATGLAVALVASAALMGAGAGSAGASSGARTKVHASGTGPVDVLYAGSLVTLMQTTLDAAFHKATGDTVTGIAGGSTALAAEIKGGVHQADVFISAAASVNASLEGSANGNWERWYVTFATSPLLIGYDPHSAFAHSLRTMPWWKVVAKPGFLLGRTNPITDPKGVLAVNALESTAARRHVPALDALAKEPTDVFPEQTMVGRLQAGQLDAGFFYDVEAKAGKIPTVPLTGTRLHGTYTISVLEHAPHARAAVAFVKFMLSPRGRSILKRNGLVPLMPPSLSGSLHAVPESLRHTVSRPKR